MQRQGFHDSAADRRRHDLSLPNNGRRSSPTTNIRWCTKDASRAVGVCSDCSFKGTCAWPFVAETRADYAATRERHLRNKSDTVRVSLAEARANKFRIDWSTRHARTQTARTGAHYDLAKLAENIDWTPFASWELHGKF